MERKKFLLATFSAFPLAVFGQIFKSKTIKNSERPNKPFVVKANVSRFGEKTLLGGKSPNDIKVSQKDTDGELSIFEYTGNEKGGPPLHIHYFQDEIFYILEGNYLFQVGEEQHNLKAGDTIFLPRKIKHAFAQLSDFGKMFFLFQPSGKMEDFFREATNPNPKKGSDLFKDHDMEIVGPPLKF